MKRIYGCTLLCLGLFAQIAIGQDVTLSGYIKDQDTGETLIGATVQIQELEATGAVSNEYGFYSLTIPQGSYTIISQYIGYDLFTIKKEFKEDTRYDIILGVQELQLQEVTVTGQKIETGIESAQFGVEKLSMSDIKTIPVLLGERDVMKTIQLLPGVSAAGEGNAGFFVRGGASDQNLILLDEAPVYNPSHLLGFFSTFNADAIKDVALYKGGMPAQYGGRLSSVLDIKMKEGNNQDYSASGGIGLISSRLNVEGPLGSDKGSFLVSGRRTYADLFLGFLSDSTLNSNTLYFYDLNAKVNYTLGEKDRIFLSGYFGRDELGTETFGIDWGNTTATLRWNHLFNDKLFSNTTFIYSNYNYNIGITAGDDDFEIASQIRDYNFKQDFQWYPNANNTVKFGLQAIHHTLSPNSIEASADASINERDGRDRYGVESSAFISHEWKINPKFNILYGLRLSAFTVLGGGDFFTYDEEGNITSTTTYDDGEIVENYFNLEPRFSISYLLDDRSSLKFSYARNTQYLHLLSNSTSTTPTDLWMPTTNYIEPEIADQIAVGYFRNFGENQGYEFSVETYYKWLQNQIDYRNGAEVQGNENVEAELLFGDGRAYGIEFLLRKNTGRLTGWISYTLSRTERQIDGINNGEYYPARQDRTHDVSIVGMYQLTPKWSLSANWVYYTGNAVTFPSGKYEVNGNTSFYYTERNGYRMPDYHRFDLGATYQHRKTKKFESEWTFSVYNAYNRRNAFAIDFRESEDDPTQTEAVKTYLFGIVPSVSWNFKF